MIQAAWTIALAAYVAYAWLAAEAYSVAQKAGVASGFVIVSLSMWLVLRHHGK